MLIVGNLGDGNFQRVFAQMPGHWRAGRDRDDPVPRSLRCLAAPGLSSGLRSAASNIGLGIRRAAAASRARRRRRVVPRGVPGALTTRSNPDRSDSGRRRRSNAIWPEHNQIWALPGTRLRPVRPSCLRQVRQMLPCVRYGRMSARVPQIVSTTRNLPPVCVTPVGGV
jgi:hypothetical protein